MSENKESMAALAIPKEHLEFVQRNPKLAQKYGTMVAKLLELLEIKRSLEKILNNPDIFAHLIENGTKEELAALQQAVLKGAEKSFYFDAVPEGFHKTFFDKMKEKDPNVQVVTTEVGERVHTVEMAESKEA